MSVRTDSEAVKGVLVDNYDEDEDTGEGPDLTPFIEAASSVVDDVSACAIAKGKALTSAKLELIERWLSAHFYVMNDPTFRERANLTSKAVFDGSTGMYLEASRFGQMAVTLDSSGCLSAIASGTRKKASAGWLGLPPSEQVPYWQRD